MLRVVWSMDGQYGRRIRAGLLTYHFSDNFGALMQAYGLRTWLRRQGVDAQFINYHPGHVEDGGRLRNPLDPRQAKANAKILYLKLAAIQRRFFGDRAQARKFADFQAEDLGVVGPRLETAAEVQAFLLRPENRFDLLICGSDQIWAPSQQYGVDPVYYLDFPSGAQGARRAAYAPSFGRADLDPVYEAAVRGYLAGFDGLSARERSGVEIVASLTGRDVAWVPDPTILLGDYAELAARAGADSEGRGGEGHVFCYALRTGQGIREVAEAAAALTGAPIVSPYNVHRRWREIGATIHPSPAEWVSQVARAGYVVSNSFHGTVFAILFRKPFVSVALPGKRAALNERSRTLLVALGLESRFVDAADMTAARRILAAPVDWSVAEPRLAAMQAQGRAYLAAQIERVSA